jgi:DNA modification methylase
VAQLDTGASGPVRRYFYQADWQLERLEDTYPLTYSAKAQSREREAGLDDQPRQTVNDGRQTPIDNPFQRGETRRRNTHPTVKPLKMTTHLATLALPPERYAPRRLLVPFSGSGSEMIGALLAGWESVTGIEQDPTYRAIAERRLAAWHQVMEKLGVRDPQTLLARWDEAQRLIETGQMTMFDLFDLHDQREAS